MGPLDAGPERLTATRWPLKAARLRACRSGDAGGNAPSRWWSADYPAAQVDPDRWPRPAV